MKAKLSKKELTIEKALVAREFRSVGKGEFQRIAQAVARRKKDAVLTLRINSGDLQSLKRKAKKLGVPYQTFISELLHKLALP